MLQAISLQHGFGRKRPAFQRDKEAFRRFFRPLPFPEVLLSAGGNHIEYKRSEYINTALTVIVTDRAVFCGAHIMDLRYFNLTYV